ncbi:MAG: Deoxyuridine 5'-triphosphate nucleotidohydrolase [Microgenomates bacterium 39_7]|nr:MAG: Deoxyuridine 5'-triphosphate nucleotidohydrolase [Microgenomates bacterium 39_7]
MKIKIKLIDKSLPLPSYQTDGSAAFDLYARKSMIIKPRTVAKVPLNVVIQLPENHWLLMAARSSLQTKGLMLINGIGVGDYDFRGPGDEYQAALFNFSDDEVEIKKGERLTQAIILQRERAQIEEIEEMAEQKNRGGFGSTGS